jgi:Tol biopolymer transport system component
MNISRVSILYAVLIICELLLFRSVFMSTSLKYSAEEERARNNKVSIDHISFSNDGKKILFERYKGRKGSGGHFIDVYDLEKHELCAYQSPPGEYWTMARYSHDGRHIVFCIQKKSDPLQIVIMDSDGKNIKQIATGGEYPTFSHTGDKVIFEKCVKGVCDIYEVDINTNAETRLTWLNVHLLSHPFEFPDGATMVFSAKRAPDLTPEWDGRCYMVKKGDKQLPQPFVIPGNRNPLLSDRVSTKTPLISRDGKRIVFQGLALRPHSKYTDCQQYFEYSTTGIYRRITHIPIPDSCIVSADLSPDGQYLAIIFEINSGRDEPKRIAICNIQDGTYREINLPDQPSRIINQQIKEKAEHL